MMNGRAGEANLPDSRSGIGGQARLRRDLLSEGIAASPPVATSSRVLASGIGMQGFGPAWYQTGALYGLHSAMPNLRSVGSVAPIQVTLNPL